MGDHDAGEKNRARNADERKKEIKGFSYPGKSERPDGKDIDQNAEAKAEQETDRFNHGADSIQSRFRCQHHYSPPAYQDFLFDSASTLNYYSVHYGTW